MASQREWAFDIEEHVREYYADKIGFVPDDIQRYDDRITGYVTGGGVVGYRSVIIPRAVGADNAARYHKWVAVNRVQWDGMRSRPDGWRYFILMIGLLPDGQPWWSRLYEERVLAEQRDFSENMGGFYRFDPGLTEKAFLAEWHKDRPGAQAPGGYAASLGGEQREFGDSADLIAALWDYSTVQGGEVTGRIDVTPDEIKVHIE